MKKLLALALAAMMTAASFAGCGNSTAAPAAPEGASAAPEGASAAEEPKDAIKLGVLAPLTGEVAIYGIATSNGIQMAIEEINAAGGVLGKQLKPIVLDEKGDISEAVNAYNRLLNDDIVALLGDVTSKPTMAVAELAATDNMPMITATGTALPITTYGSNIFRTCFTDPFQGKIMATFAADNLGAKNVAIIYNTSDDYSTGLTASFKEQAAAKGITIVAEEGYGNDDKDFKSQLTNIQSKKPDAIFIPDYYTKVALIATQAREVGYEGPMIGADGWDGVLGVLDDANKSALNNCYMSNHYSPESTDEKVVSFVQNYTAKYGETPNSFAALGYDTAYLVAQAITTAGSTDAQAIIDAIKAIAFTGVTGSITFDENNNPIKDAAVLKLMDGVATYDSTVSGK